MSDQKFRGRKSKHTVGDRVFGLIREARDGQPLTALLEVAENRDRQAVDTICKLEKSDFFVGREVGSKNNVVEWRDNALTESAVSQLAKMIGVTDKQMTEFDPDIIHFIMERNLAEEDKQVRLYNTGTDQLVRAFVSTDYKHKPSVDLVSHLINEHQSRLDSLRITSITDTPDYLGADVIDIDQQFDVNLLGVAGPVPEDILFPGWQFNINDIGLASASLNSYLWRLVCNNGSAVIDQASRMRSIHRGSTELRGNLILGHQWQDIILQAKGGEMRTISSEEAMKKMKRLAQRPPIDILTDVWNRIELQGDGQTFNRYALAQAFGDTANRVPQGLRSKLQSISGQLLLNSTSKVLPVLDSILV